MNRKGQEEMVGFALIILIVAIAGVILLAIGLQDNDRNVQRESVEIGQFLESSIQVTSDCAINSKNDFEDVGSLIRVCYENPSRNCFSEESVCEALNKSLNGVIASLQVGNESYYKGYELAVGFEDGDDLENFLEVSKGECNFNRIGNEVLISGSRASGSFVLELQMCT